MSRQVTISKFLAKVLRHGHDELKFGDDGTVKIKQLLRLGPLKRMHVKQREIEDIVVKNNKQRFQIIEDRIRAVQGHSFYINPEKLFRKLELSDEEPPPLKLVHGTYLRCLESIMKNGLNKMDRQYIHFTTSTDLSKVVSGFRSNSEVLIIVDFAKATEKGHTFYLANNNVVLTEGPIEPELLQIKYLK